ncbi:MAG: ECF transporter S component [Armatimonadetes bacterium]|nr:ECF transporter S component [Armatimonadota bacterium]
MPVLRDTTRVSILSALGCLLMFVQVPLFPSAPFLTYDAGDIPVLIAAFALGPWKGVAAAALKNVLFLFLHPTPDLFVGAPMNFLAGASMAFVAGSLYQARKTKTRAIVSLVVGVAAMTVVMLGANLLVLPWFVRVFFPGVPAEVKGAMLLGTILPFNVLKGSINAVLCFLVYKRISPVLKAANWEMPTPAPAAATSR